MNITYPDGSQLTSTALTDDQIQLAFQIITCQMLGILTDPWGFTITLAIGQFVLSVNSVSNLYIGQIIVAAGVPVGTTVTGVDPVAVKVYLSNAATANGVVNATVTDPQAPYKVRIGWQIEGQPGPPIGEDTVTVRCVPWDTDYGRMRDVTGTVLDTTITQTDVFTRGWKTIWTFYGPGSLDKARAVRSGLITIDFVANYLAGINLYVIPSIKEPERVPDNFQARWWERVDMEVKFYEQITETFTVGTVGSVEVKVYTKDGEIADFTVTE